MNLAARKLNAQIDGELGILQPIEDAWQAKFNGPTFDFGQSKRTDQVAAATVHYDNIAIWLR